MKVKKYHNTIFGMDLSSAEEKALNIEIQKKYAEYDRKNAIEVDAIAMVVLHEQFGFGAERLKKFYLAIKPEIDKLVSRYEMEEGDAIWLCTNKLKGIGVDLEAWHKESGLT